MKDVSKTVIAYQVDVKGFGDFQLVVPTRSYLEKAAMSIQIAFLDIVQAY